MKKPLVLPLAGAAMAAIFALWWLRSADFAEKPPSGEPSVALADEYEEAPASSALAPLAHEPLPQEVSAAGEPTLFGFPPGLTLEEQNQRRERESIANVPAAVIEHARTAGFPFTGVVVRVVRDQGFWLVAHDPIDAYMWAAENRPIHPEDPERLEDFSPGDTLRGYIFHGADRYLLRLP
jgi:hypothetical protein